MKIPIANLLVWLFIGVCIWFAVASWKNFLLFLALVVAIAVVLSTALYSLAFVLGIAKFRSVTKAHHAAWDIFKHCFAEVLNRLN
jgi:hypothetical protein